jgi:hypothetical protein
MEIDIDDILLCEDTLEKEVLKKITSDEPSDPLEGREQETKVGDSKDISELSGRLKMWHENCRDLLIDLRSVSYNISEEDSFLEFNDKNYYENRLYFKLDPQKPKDAKVVHAIKQLCKIISIPYAFFASCRPTLKTNIVKTWQAGLADDIKKAQNIIKIRESKGCTIIRAITPVSKLIIPLHELIQIIKDSVTEPFKLECAYGDEKDDLILHARFLFEKEYTFNGPVCMGFSVTASELGACPLSIDVLLYNKLSKTSCVASYGGESFFKSDYTGLQPSSIKDILPVMLNRLNEEIPEIFSRLEKKQIEAQKDFCAETDALEISRGKGLTSAVKKAIYHQVSECLDSIKSPWDLAMHVGLVAKDFDALKRSQIEKAIGIYLNLFFSDGSNTVEEKERDL